MTAETISPVQVTHRLGASPARVFDAWVDARRAGRWLFAEDIQHREAYLEMERPRRLVFIFAAWRFSPETTLVRVEITAMGKGCELTVTHAGVPPEYAARAADGWTQMLAELGRLLAR